MPQDESFHEAEQKIEQARRENATTLSLTGMNLTELPESNWCCGSAGVYNITQPEMANELLERKMGHIKSTGANVVATGNPGCLLQIVNGAKNEGIHLRVVHPVTLLAEAYRRSR